MAVLLLLGTQSALPQGIAPRPGSVGSGDQHDLDDDTIPLAKCLSCTSWMKSLSAILSDGLISGRYRSQFNSQGESVRNQFQYRTSFKFKYDLPGTDGRFSLKAEAMSGARVDSDWIDGFGQDEGLRRSFSLRNLYLHMEPFKIPASSGGPLKAVSIDFGFMPINPKSIRGDAVLSPDRQVPFDGLRLNLSTKHPWIKEIAIQGGAVKQLNDFNVWERGTNLTRPNTLQIFVRGDINRFLTYVQEYSRIQNLSLSRSMLEIVPAESIKVIDRLVLEYLASNTQRVTQGYSVQAIKDLGVVSTWISFSRRFPETLQVADGQIPRENLFRTAGPLISGYVQWNKSPHFQPYIRFTKGVGNNQEIFGIPSFRTGPFSPRSLRWEVGFRVPLRRR